MKNRIFQLLTMQVETFGLSLCCFISGGTSCLPYGTYVWISARLCVLFWPVAGVIALGDGRTRWHSRTLSKLSSSHPASSHGAPPPPTPMPSLSHCGSLSPKNHTPSLPSDVHTCSLYKASPHPHPHFSVSGASVHNDTVSFLERVYCPARVYTNVVLQFGAHNTRDREIIKHCTGKKTKKTKE